MPELDFISAGISCSSPYLIVIFFGDAKMFRGDGGISTQLVKVLSSLDLKDSDE